VTFSGTPNAYAVTDPSSTVGNSQPTGSSPNSVSTNTVSPYNDEAITATFATPQSQVTIVVFQECQSECLGSAPNAAAAYLNAYDVNGNLLMHTIANPNTWNSWQVLGVVGTNIAYVVFGVPADPSNVQLVAAFDNLTF
jgi:hypothetical protein